MIEEFFEMSKTFKFDENHFSLNSFNSIIIETQLIVNDIVQKVDSNKKINDLRDEIFTNLIVDFAFSIEFETEIMSQIINITIKIFVTTLQ